MDFALQSTIEKSIARRVFSMRKGEHFISQVSIAQKKKASARPWRGGDALAFKLLAPKGKKLPASFVSFKLMAFGRGSRQPCEAS